MANHSVYDQLMSARDRHGAGFLLLIDPDRLDEKHYVALAEAAQDCGVDAIMVGTSLLLNADFATAVTNIKYVTSLPVILFPGSSAQISPDADAILFFSLLSGRNPTYLVEEQVKAAPLIRQFGLETISTGYLLIESGAMTSVQYVSSSLPIPRAKPDIACAHALAAQYFGMKMVYLDAGSGAPQTVPSEMVRHVSDGLEIPVMVGGGLTTAQECAEKVTSGASFVVVGNHFENDHDFSMLNEFAAAVHDKESIVI